MIAAGWMLAFLCVFGAYAAPALAGSSADIQKQEKLYKNIESAWKSGKYPALRNFIDQNVDRFDRRKILADWGRQNFTQSLTRDPQIGFVYAETLGRMATEYRATRNVEEYHRGMKIGLRSFIGSQIIAFENIARCDDRTVGEIYLAPWLSGETYDLYKSYLEGLSTEVRDTVMQDAFKLAETRNLYRKDVSLCATGADAQARAQVARDCQQVADARGEVCNAEAHVKFVSDEAWSIARAKLQDAVRRRVQEGKL